MNKLAEEHAKRPREREKFGNLEAEFFKKSVVMLRWRPWYLYKQDRYSIAILKSIIGYVANIRIYL